MEYLETNKKHWNQKVGVHVQSEFYDHQSFLNGKSSLNKIELDLLGDISGKKVLHLQCHFGQDSISLARMGAEVTAVDFSEEAIRVGNETASELGMDINFICCNVFDLRQHVQEKFDLVFASYGVIGWHPDLMEWNRLVSDYLNENGRHILVEFHPYLWMWEDNFTRLAYSYFNQGPIIEELEGTYADRNSEIKWTSYCWNHALTETIQSAIANGLTIEKFNEYNFSPYEIFENMEQVSKGYQLKAFPGQVPMVFSLVARKK